MEVGAVLDRVAWQFERPGWSAGSLAISAWRRAYGACALSVFVLDAAVVVHRCSERVSEEDRADYHLKLEGNVLRNLRPAMFQMLIKNNFQMCSFVMLKCP